MSAIPMKNASSDELKKIELELLQPHPQNPRKIDRRDVIEPIAAQLRASGAFDPCHALLVRPFNGHYQIVSGHNRVEAARQAGLVNVPAWVRDLTDEEAFLQLILCNSQGELHSLEKGEHARLAVEAGMTLREYAAQIHQKEETARTWQHAAEVAKAVMNVHDFSDLTKYVSALAVIHGVEPHTDWAQWVERLLKQEFATV